MEVRKTSNLHQEDSELCLEKFCEQWKEKSQIYTGTDHLPHWPDMHFICPPWCLIWEPQLFPSAAYH